MRAIRPHRPHCAAAGFEDDRGAVGILQAMIEAVRAARHAHGGLAVLVFRCHEEFAPAVGLGQRSDGQPDVAAARIVQPLQSRDGNIRPQTQAIDRKRPVHSPVMLALPLPGSFMPVIPTLLVSSRTSPYSSTTGGW